MIDKNSLELRAIGILCNEIRITTEEIKAYAKSGHTALFVSLSIAALITLDAFRYRDAITMFEDVVLWTSTILLHFCLFVGLSLVWAWGQDRLGLFRPFLPMFGVAAFTIVLPFNITLFEFFAAPAVGFPLTKWTILKGLSVVVIFEAFFFVFVHPLLHHTPQGTSPVSSERIISGAGMTFAIPEIQFLQGQEHYVQVVTDAGAQRVRARLGDLVSQTRAEDGIQAHRSYWVSRIAIKGLVSRDGSDLIVLKSGEELPVARPRRDAVRTWFDLHHNGGSGKQV